MPRGGSRPGAGRPSGKKNLASLDEKADLSALTRGYAETAVRALVDVAENGSSESARVSAANALLDRAFGRPATAPQSPQRDTVEEFLARMRVEMQDAESHPTPGNVIS